MRELLFFSLGVIFTLMTIVILAYISYRIRRRKRANILYQEFLKYVDRLKEQEKKTKIKVEQN